MRTFVGLAIAIIVMAATHQSVAQDIPILAVMEIEDKTGKFERNDMEAATEVLSALLVSSGSYAVVDKSRQAAKRQSIVRELRRESHDACYDESCRIQLGRELAADSLLSCVVVGLGRHCTLSCCIVPLDKAVAEKAGIAKFKCGVDEMPGAVESVAGRLATVKRASEKAAAALPLPLTGKEFIAKFESRPPGAQVEVDGVPRRTAPCSIYLTQGTHKIRMTLPRYEPQEEVAVIDADKTFDWELAPTFGWLKVTSAPPGLDVSIKQEGREETWSATTPSPELKLDSGRYVIDLKDGKYRSVTETVVVTKGQTTVAQLAAEAQQGYLKVKVFEQHENAIAADVVVDRTKMGRAPGPWAVDVGKRIIEVLVDGKKVATKTTLIIAGETSELRISVNSAALAKAETQERLGRLELQIDRAAKDGSATIPENLFDVQMQATIGRIEPLDSEDPTGKNKVTPVSIPKVVRAWMVEAEQFILLEHNDEDSRYYASMLAFQIAKVYMRYGHFAETRRRLETILEDRESDPLLIVYCYLDLARTYHHENDLDQLGKVTRRMKEDDVGEQTSMAEVHQSIADARLRARFLRAGALLEEAKDSDDASRARELYSAAALELETIADENPQFDKADLCLLEAGRSFEQANLNARAARLYQRVVEEKRFSESAYREAALSSLADSYESSFAFGKATETYLRFAREYPKSDELKSVLLKAAHLFEMDQDYLKAAELLVLLIKSFPDWDSTPKLVYLLVDLYQKGGDKAAARRAAAHFVKNYGSSPALASPLMKATIKLGRWASEEGDGKAAQEHFKRVVRLYNDSGMKTGSKGAYIAAEAAFHLAESGLKGFFALQLGGTADQQRKNGTGKRDKLLVLEAMYGAVTQYGATNWSVAAIYRVGLLWSELGQAFATAPYPTDLPKDEDFKYQYQVQIGDLTARFEDKARTLWRSGVEFAQRAGIIGIWTYKILGELHRYPEDRTRYPLYRPVKLHRSDIRGGGFRTGAGSPDSRRMGDSQSWISALEKLVASEDFTAALELARSRLTENETDIEAIKILGILYYRIGKYKTAKYAFERARKLAPTDHESLFCLALVEDSLDKRVPVKVLAAYDKALKVNPDYPEALNNAGVTLWESRNYEAAVEKFTEALKHAPGFEGAKLNLANALRGVKKYDEADKIYSQLAAGHSKSAAAYFNRGVLYLENEFGGMDVDDLRDKAAGFFDHYRTVMGSSLPEDDPAEEYALQARTLGKEYRAGKEEERRRHESQKARLEDLKPVYMKVLGEDEELKLKLKEALDMWGSGGDTSRSSTVREAMAQHDNMLGPLLSELEMAMKLGEADEVEYILEEIDSAMTELRPLLDEALQASPP
jgi:tetratricopeptide (TPR) repeat protein